MKKISLDHTADSLNGAFGVSDERFRELMKAMGHGVVESIDSQKKSKNYQYVYEVFKPVNEEELMLLGFFMGLSEAHQDLHSHVIEAAISEMTESKHPLGDILRKKPKVHES